MIRGFFSNQCHMLGSTSKFPGANVPAPEGDNKHSKCKTFRVWDTCLCLVASKLSSAQNYDSARLETLPLVTVVWPLLKVRDCLPVVLPDSHQATSHFSLSSAQHAVHRRCGRVRPQLEKNQSAVSLNCASNVPLVPVNRSLLDHFSSGRPFRGKNTKNKNTFMTSVDHYADHNYRCQVTVW